MSLIIQIFIRSDFKQKSGFLTIKMIFCDPLSYTKILILAFLEIFIKIGS